MYSIKKLECEEYKTPVIRLNQTQGCIKYLGPFALFAEKVSVTISLHPVLLKGVGPHQLPVTQVVNLMPLFLGCDTCEKLFLGLQRRPYTLNPFFLGPCQHLLIRPTTHKCEVSFEQSNSGNVEKHEGSLWKKNSTIIAHDLSLYQQLGMARYNFSYMILILKLGSICQY